MKTPWVIQIEALQAALTAAMEIIHLQRAWIMAVPQETVLPAMPGFDREWADRKIAQIEALKGPIP